ncbi:hypothetical protein BpHYR1_036259 [Brachionus plicatilis]|uniref:Uncharacterized protein n=1 Tax=Brachionus plicatilis TaxID=10195 RepID=A0A3M7RBI6_BRAPC|nr:hypothetical protein BpHYR1_036259 [Brachionus plicatilis]
MSLIEKISNNISQDQAFEPNTKGKTRENVFTLWRMLKNALIENLREITGLKNAEDQLDRKRQKNKIISAKNSSSNNNCDSSKSTFLVLFVKE